MQTTKIVRALILVGGVLAGVAATAMPASAQVVHSISFGAGMFTPRSEDNRTTGDVWYADLNQPVAFYDVNGKPVTGSLAFDIKSFRSLPVYGEWHIGFGNHVEVGVSGGYANQTVKSAYRDLVNSNGSDNPADWTEITQDLRLQTIPISGVVRFLGGRPGHFQPYGGAGVVAVIFNYTETGDFVDSTDWSTIYNAKYTTGWKVGYGPVVLGGARVPLGGDVYALNFEGRYQWAVGKTGGFDAGFLGDKIDLGGWFLGASFLIRF
jgi:hypothetical protein